MKKILLGLLLCMMLVPLVSADIFEFDNIGQYNEETRTMTIKNSILGIPFLDLDVVAKIELISDDLVYVMRGDERLVGEFKVINYEDYNGFFDGMGFLDLNNQRRKTNKNLKWKYKKLEYIEVPETIEVCEDIINESGTNEVCNQVNTGEEITIENYVWKAFNKNSMLPAGEITIGLFTDVEAGEHIDWVPTFFGVEIPQWSEWTESLEIDLLSYYKLNDLGTSTTVLDHFDFSDGVKNSNNPVNVTGHIAGAYEFEYNDKSAINLSTSFQNMNRNWTISMWANISSHPDGRYSSYVSLGGNGGFGLDEGDSDNIGLSKAGDLNVGCNTPFVDGQWALYTLTVNDTDCMMYKNGSLVSVSTMGANVGAGTLIGMIGNNAKSTVSTSHNSQIDEVGIWNRTLTPAEALQLYNNYTGITPPFRPSLTVTQNEPVDNYHVNVSPIVFNCSANGNQGVLNLTLIIGGVKNYTVTNSSANQNLSLEQTLYFPDNTDSSWSCNASDNFQEITSATRTFHIHSGIPEITIFHPTSSYIVETPSENISLNYSITDPFLDSCWYLTSENSTIVILNCSTNSSLLYPITNPDNLTIYVYGNDTFGNQNFSQVTINKNTTSPIILINNPISVIDYGYIGKNETLNYTVTHDLLDTCGYETTIINFTEVSCTSGVNNETIFPVLFVNNSQSSLNFIANDTLGNINSTLISWNYTVFTNNVTYEPIVIEGGITSINTSLSILTPPVSIMLNYSGVLSSPVILSSGTTYFVYSSIIIPEVGGDSNVTFNWVITVSNQTIQTLNYTQLVQDVTVLTECTPSTFTLLNISNYDEDLLVPINGTVEYVFNLKSNDISISTISGNQTGTNFEICSLINLNESITTFGLELRYYVDDSTYLYETYNIENLPVSSLPSDLFLYFLNSTNGVQFKINYEDFNYLEHPRAIVQVQRQYLTEDDYKVVEIPKIGDDGQSTGSFNVNNIRYKVLVVEGGEILDTFEDIFPVCQNALLGTCEIDLRGREISSTTTVEDFSYSLLNTGSSIILTYIIPSGTPSDVVLNTVQDSRFLDSISTCTIGSFGSGGTLSCSYNSTVGDSTVSIFINSSSTLPIYGSVHIPEDLSGAYLLNNYVIGFVLLLTLGLIFISSGVLLVIVSVVGVMFLGLIFLLRGLNTVTVGSSILWFLIAGIMLAYKIAQKEERT